MMSKPETSKIHGFTMIKGKEISILKIGKNNMPVYKDQVPQFKTNHTERLSPIANGLIDHLFKFNDHKEKARCLHVLSQYLFHLETNLTKERERGRELATEIERLNLLVREIKPESPLKLLTARGKAEMEQILGPARNSPVHLIKRKAFGLYLEHLNTLHEMVYRTTHTSSRPTGAYSKLYLHEEEYPKYSSEEVSELWAHGFIHAIFFKNVLPQGIPYHIAEAILSYYCQEGSTIFINREIPEWDIFEMKRRFPSYNPYDGKIMKINIFIEAGIVIDYDPLKRYEPTVVDEYFLEHCHYTPAGLYTLEKIYSNKFTDIFLVIREDSLEDEEDEVASVSTSIGEEMAHRMEK